VQGLGNVGYHAAKFLQTGGAVIIGLAEIEGGICNRNGLDVEEVMKFRRERNSLLGFPGAEDITPSSRLLELECDILVPAALEEQITATNADRIRAKIVAEAANGPVTSDADEMLLDRGVLILPDVFLNAGGVTVSYFEWLRNLSHVRFGRMSKRFEQNSQTRLLRAVEEMTGQQVEPDVMRDVIHGADEIDLVESGLEETMIHAYNEIRNLAGTHTTDLRTAAFISAINKIAVLYQEMGIFP
jgi:glutamate dehydrogenase (NAD(P)+)